MKWQWNIHHPIIKIHNVLHILLSLSYFYNRTSVTKAQLVHDISKKQILCITILLIRKVFFKRIVLQMRVLSSERYIVENLLKMLNSLPGLVASKRIILYPPCGTLTVSLRGRFLYSPRSRRSLCSISTCSTSAFDTVIVFGENCPMCNTWNSWPCKWNGWCRSVCGTVRRSITRCRREREKERDKVKGRDETLTTKQFYIKHMLRFKHRESQSWRTGYSRNLHISLTNSKFIVNESPYYLLLI